MHRMRRPKTIADDCSSVIPSLRVCEEGKDGADGESC
jgi:hypothetical protein